MDDGRCMITITLTIMLLSRLSGERLIKSKQIVQKILCHEMNNKWFSRKSLNPVGVRTQDLLLRRQLL